MYFFTEDGGSRNAFNIRVFIFIYHVPMFLMFYSLTWICFICMISWESRGTLFRWDETLSHTVFHSNHLFLYILCILYISHLIFMYFLILGNSPLLFEYYRNESFYFLKNLYMFLFFEIEETFFSKRFFHSFKLFHILIKPT